MSTLLRLRNHFSFAADTVGAIKLTQPKHFVHRVSSCVFFIPEQVGFLWMQWPVDPTKKRVLDGIACSLFFELGTLDPVAVVGFSFWFLPSFTFFWAGREAKHTRQHLKHFCTTTVRREPHTIGTIQRNRIMDMSGKSSIARNLEQELPVRESWCQTGCATNSFLFPTPKKESTVIYCLRPDDLGSILVLNVSSMFCHHNPKITMLQISPPRLDP